ncbi:MAG: hypothetical protein KDB14_10910, partial [Planctomycetales bacterium]|nr:hypothetical protein [Planctomycetales bacterium]
MTRPSLHDNLRRRRQLTRKQKDRKKSQFLRDLRVESLEDRRMLAGLVISEIMWNPDSNETDWEWIEVVNTDPVNSVELSDYVLDTNAGPAGTVGTITAAPNTLIGPGQTAVLVSDKTQSPGDFSAAWNSTANFISVVNWQELFNASGGDHLGIWDSTLYNSRDYGAAEDDVAYLSPGFPAVTGGGSIYISDLNDDNSLGANWSVSVNGVDGAFVSVGGGVFPQNTSADIGSPGIVPISLSVSDVTITEGDVGTSLLTFDVSASSALSGAQSFTVNYATAAAGSGADATAGLDYTATSGTLTFNSGSALSQQVSVTVLNEDLVELDEFLNFELSGLTTTGGTFGIAPFITDGIGLGTILNDDSATLTIANNGGNEDGGPITFTATLSSPVDVPVTFDVLLGLGGDTALIADSDYSPASVLGNSIAAGLTSTTFNITPTADNKVEADEAFTLVLSNLGAGSPARDVTLGPNATGTIVNDDAAQVSVSDVSVTETDTTDTTLTFDIQLDNPVDVDVTVNYTLAAGTATSGVDFTGASGSVVIAAGSLSAPVNVTVHGDLLVEADETLSITLDTVVPDQPRDVSIDTGADSAVGTIVDNDFATLSINDVSFVEDTAGGQLIFSVTLDNDVDTGFTIDFASAIGGANPATAGVDYTAVSGPLAFAGVLGETQQIIVPITAENLVELDETLLMNLSNVSISATHDVTFLDNQGLGTIVNDDNAVVTVNDILAVSEGTIAGPGVTAYNFIVQLSNPVDVNVTLDYLTVDGTAVDGDDFTAISGLATFLSGATSETLVVNVIADSKVEANEAFILRLENLAASGRDVTFDGAGAFLEADADVLNDDSATLAFAPGSVSISQNEGTGGTVTNYVFTVDLSAEVDTDVAVAFNTNDGTATVADNDYNALSGNLVIAAGALSGTITVEVNHDAKVELDENFTLDLTTITFPAIVGTRNVSLAGATQQATGVIVNDDIANVTINDVSVTEGGTLVFAVTVDAEVDAPFDVSFSTADLTALIGDNDYAANSGTLSFLAGISPNQTINVNVATITDGIVELDETLHLDLTSLVLLPGYAGSVVLLDNQGLGTILNDDSATLSIGDVLATNEGNAGTQTYSFSVDLTAPVDTNVSIDFATADDSATAGSDYLSASGTVTFTTGSTTATVDVTVNGDNTVELNEQFFVNLINATLNAGGRAVTVLDNQGVGEIVNDDSATLTINDVTAVEGDAGTTAFNFTVTLSNPVDVAVTFDHATADDTATTGDSDYTGLPLTGTSILAGATSGTITVQVTGDNKVELDEQFFVDLSNLGASGRAVTITDNQGVGTILNDDAAELSINDVTLVEGD